MLENTIRFLDDQSFGQSFSLSSIPPPFIYINGFNMQHVIRDVLTESYEERLTTDEI